MLRFEQLQGAQGIVLRSNYWREKCAYGSGAKVLDVGEIWGWYN
jgi:hypothetical protein